MHHNATPRTKGTPSEKIAIRQYSHIDLRDRMTLLAILYSCSDNLKKAVETLNSSKRLCELHGIKFDSEDLLKDYVQRKLKRNRSNKRSQ